MSLAQDVDGNFVKALAGKTLSSLRATLMDERWDTVRVGEYDPLAEDNSHLYENSPLAFPRCLVSTKSRACLSAVRALLEASVSTNAPTYALRHDKCVAHSLDSGQQHCGCMHVMQPRYTRRSSTMRTVRGSHRFPGSGCCTTPTACVRLPRMYIDIEGAPYRLYLQTSLMKSSLSVFPIYPGTPLR